MHMQFYSSALCVYAIEMEPLMVLKLSNRMFKPNQETRNDIKINENNCNYRIIEYLNNIKVNYKLNYLTLQTLHVKKTYTGNINDRKRYCLIDNW